MIAHNQKGFTLIEVVLAMAIAGVLLPVLASSIFQIVTGTDSIVDGTAVTVDLDSASRWFTKDLSQATSTDVVDSAPPVSSMRVSWVDATAWATPGQEAHCARYYVVGEQLLRNYDGASECTVDGTVTVVASSVGSMAFSRVGNFVTVSMTSTSEQESQTLSYFITPRVDGNLTTP